MKLIIDIPEEVYTRLFDNGRPMDIADGIVIDRALRLGKPLTESDDCVSRSELLKALDTWNKFGVDGTGHLFRLDNLSYPHYEPYIHYRDVIKAVKGMPSVQPKRDKGEWIPVSERLPKTFSYVNCTCHSLIDDRADWVVETCYIPQPKGGPYSDWGNIPMLNHGDCEVVAWMYRDIPKPYKAESEDD